MTAGDGGRGVQDGRQSIRRADPGGQKGSQEQRPSCAGRQDALVALRPLVPSRPWCGHLLRPALKNSAVPHISRDALHGRDDAPILGNDDERRRDKVELGISHAGQSCDSLFQAEGAIGAV